MKMLRLPGYTGLVSALNLAAEAWYPDEYKQTAILEAEHSAAKDAAGMLIRGAMASRLGKAPEPEALARSAQATELIKSYRAKQAKRQAVLEEAWERLRGHLIVSDIAAFQLGEHGIHSVGALSWVHRSLERLSDLTSDLHQEAETTFSIYYLKQADLEAFIVAKTDHQPAPTTAAQEAVNKAEAPKRRRRSADQQEKARTALFEMYGATIPAPGQVGSNELYARVGKHLKAQGLDCPSRDTVLRAAGRKRRMRGS